MKLSLFIFILYKDILSKEEIDITISRWTLWPYEALFLHTSDSWILLTVFLEFSLFSRFFRITRCFHGWKSDSQSFSASKPLLCSPASEHHKRTLLHMNHRIVASNIIHHLEQGSPAFLIAREQRSNVWRLFGRILLCAQWTTESVLIFHSAFYLLFPSIRLDLASCWELWMSSDVPTSSLWSTPFSIRSEHFSPNWTPFRIKLDTLVSWI